MLNFLKKVWQAWKRFAFVLGRINTTILLTVVYFLIIPVFSLMRFKDPLRKRLGGESYWQPFQGRAISLEQFNRMY